MGELANLSAWSCLFQTPERENGADYHSLCLTHLIFKGRKSVWNGPWLYRSPLWRSGYFSHLRLGRKGVTFAFQFSISISFLKDEMQLKMSPCEDRSIAVNIPVSGWLLQVSRERTSLHLLPTKRRAVHGERGSQPASLLCSSLCQRTDLWASPQQHQVELYELWFNIFNPWALSPELQLHHCSETRVRRQGMPLYLACYQAA